jgi:hypothetical protein
LLLGKSRSSVITIRGSHAKSKNDLEGRFFTSERE